MSGHCGRFSTPVTRREMLSRCACGFGGVAFSSLLAGLGRGAEAGPALDAGGRVASGHPAARARNIIFLYMDGGPSQLDTFDPKPLLQRDSGKPFPMKKERTQFNDNGVTLGSPWSFAQHGESGIWVSSLFPHVATVADELCVVRSMTSKFSEHTNANYFLHTGLGLSGRPSMGAWMSYGLGSENDNLPAFVVLNGGLVPPGGLDCFGNGFLPARHQGSLVRPDGAGLANVEPREVDPALQRRKLEFAAAMDERFRARTGGADSVEAAIVNAELAYRMQAEVPELMELAGETPATHALYGTDSAYEPTRIFARECLLARRMVERGVRFVELTCPRVAGADRWDQHTNLRKGHEDNALAVDQPIAALITDLRQRGLLDETLVVWAGEFGRTPFAQGTNGRDHNPFGFTIWMAGGGTRPGLVYGATDDYGYHVVENPLEIHDLHATMLHILGVDHRLLTVRHGGRDMRLTDVHGHVITDLLA